MALVIPRDFAERVDAGRAGAGAADRRRQRLQHRHHRHRLRRGDRRRPTRRRWPSSSSAPAAAAAADPPLDVRPRVWFNADLESRNYIIPGLIAVIMMVIAALLTSLTVAREWERGTMEQLISTPVKGPELILGKLIPISPSACSTCCWPC